MTAGLPGGSPETMSSAVATPLERQFSTIAGIDSMTSTSALGATQITIQFALERNIDAAAQDVQAAMAQAARQLPPDMPTPPTYRKVNPADQPILYLALSSPTLPLSTVNEYADTLLGLAVVGGLVVSQLLTLYITLVIYISFEAARERLARRRTARRAVPVDVRQPAEPPPVPSSSPAEAD